MKRQRIEIMAQILAFCMLGRRKTQVMFGTNLSHAQLRTYLTLLKSRDLLAQSSDGYVTTERGQRFLKAFAQLNNVLDIRAHRAFFGDHQRELRGSGNHPHGCEKSSSKNTRADPAKKVAIVILIRLAHKAEKKTSEELKTEIHKTLEEGLARIPWVAVEKVIILEE